MIDVRAAAIFEIASRVVTAVRSAAFLTVSAMIPTATAKFVEQGHEVIGKIYRRYTTRTCALAFPLFSVTSVSAAFLLVAWLGSAPGDVGLLVPFLNLAYFVNATTAPATQIAIGAGYPGLASANAVLIAVLNVVFTIALAPLFGLWGVVTGTFLAFTFGSTLFSVRFLSLFNLPVRDFLAAVLPTGALAIGLALPPALLAVLVGTPDNRLSAALWLALSVTIYGVPYWLIATRLGFLPMKLEFPPWRCPTTSASSAA